MQSEISLPRAASAQDAAAAEFEVVRVRADPENT